MRQILTKIRQRLEFSQKKEWDNIAYSYLKNCNSILDIGCGEGRFLSQDLQRIVGLDWNFESVKMCKEQGYEVVQADVASLPFRDQSISAIHCSHVIEHFLPTDLHKILSEFSRILSTGRILVIASPHLWDGFYSELTHVRSYNPEGIISYLTPSRQCTLKHISQDYSVISLKWRYKPLRVKISYLNTVFNYLNRRQFPWLKKTGYMLVMKKGKTRYAEVKQ